MADDKPNAAPAAAAPAKRKRATFTRTEKPIFAIVRAVDASGTLVPLTKEGLSITLEKDSAKIVDLVTAGDMGGAVVVRVTVPAGPKRAPATTGAAA